MTYIKYKTSLCRHYDEYGKCSLGDACSFAHGEHEKRTINDVSFKSSRLLRSRISLAKIKLEDISLP